jgi:hypothetical protein
MQFAKDTTVPVEKTKAEIEGILTRYGASEFMSGWKFEYEVIGFKMRAKMMRFILPLPDRNDKAFTHTAHKQEYQRQRRTADAAAKAWEQACRQRWRALLLAIRAKLEAVECGITTFEEEFMAHIVMPDGMTLGEKVLPQLPEYLSGRPMPLLLPGPVQ